jgi:hypothetical protein
VTIIVEAPPAWAVAQIPSDDTVLHVSAEVVVETSDPSGSDAGRIYASLEQLGDSDPAIRIQGAGDQPMTLVQAWRQSLILQDLVMRALGRSVTR